MAKVLYVDPWGGVAGDMLLAAFLDLGRRRAGTGLEAVLRGAVACLGLGNVKIDIQQVRSKGLAATRVTIVEPDEAPTRGPADVEALVAAAALPDVVGERSRAALSRLAQVEAAVHGVPLERVHFHELGAVDTLVDVVGTFALWEALGRPRVVCGALPLGQGSVRTEHGLLRIPAPATLALCEGIPVHGGEEHGERTTPTGALLVTELASAWGELPAMRPDAVGYGAGCMELAHTPNVVRVVLGETVGPAAEALQPEALQGVILLETQVDDASGERLAHVRDLLLAAGALDAWLRPVIMKKGRPGVELAVLAVPEDEERLVGILIRESGTLGVRRRWVERWVVERNWVEVNVEGSIVRVKIGRWKGEPVSVAPEYEDAAAAARKSGRSLDSIMSAAAAAARSLL